MLGASMAGVAILKYVLLQQQQKINKLAKPSNDELIKTVVLTDGHFRLDPWNAFLSDYVLLPQLCPIFFSLVGLYFDIGLILLNMILLE